MSAMTNSAVQEYQSVGLHSGIADANSHRLIQMLMEGALQRIAQAKGNLERGETANKGENISVAIAIIDALQSSLDMEKGGEIAQNLEGLYNYMIRCLSDANIQNDMGKLNEVVSLLLEVKGAWDAIPDQLKGSPVN